IPRWLQRRSRVAGALLKAGIMTALVSGALAAPAVADDAYARLLKAHVRPGVVGGIKLNLVDYRAVQGAAAYGEALAALAGARPGRGPRRRAAPRPATRGTACRSSGLWEKPHPPPQKKGRCGPSPPQREKGGAPPPPPVWEGERGGGGGGVLPPTKRGAGPP